MNIFQYFWSLYKATNYIEELEGKIRVLEWKIGEVEHLLQEQDIMLINYKQEKQGNIK